MALTKAHNRMISGATVNVLDYGAVGDDVTDDTAAIQAAIDSLAGVGGTVYVPAGVYKISAAIVMTGTKGISFVGDGSESTSLKQGTNTVPVVQAGGNFINIEKLTLQHSPSVDYTKTNAIALNLVDHVSHSSFRDLRLNGSAYGIKLTTKDTSAAAVFSCTFDNLYILPYAHTGIQLIGVNSGQTGNVFNNIYINGFKGSPATAQNTEVGVYLASMTESVWNQLNIEHAQLANAFVCYGGETMVINSLHLEGLTPRSGPDGTGANYSGYIRSSNKALVINGMSLINSFYNSAYTASYSVWHSIGGSKAEFHGFVTRNNAKTGTVITDFYTPDSVANNGYCYLWNAVDSDGAGVVEFNRESNLFINGLAEGTYVVTATPSTSGTVSLQAGADTMSYSKVGRMVTCQGTINVSSIASAVGSSISLNLPFPKLNETESSEGAGAPVTYYNASSYSVIPAYVPASAPSNFQIVIDPSTLANAHTFSIQFSYIAA